MEGYLQVTAVFPSEPEARRVAGRLVELRLAACAQVSGPVHSTYWWQGKIENSVEYVCLAKTRGDLYPLVEAEIRKLHSYTVPEILASPVAAGNQDYLRWMENELKRR